MKEQNINKEVLEYSIRLTASQIRNWRFNSSAEQSDFIKCCIKNNYQAVASAIYELDSEQ